MGIDTNPSPRKFERKSPYSNKIELVDKIHVSSLADVPNVEHFAVLEMSSVSYSDPYEPSERARTMSTDFITYTAFANEQALNNFILEDAKSEYTRKSYKVIHVKPVEITLHTSVQIKAKL